MGISTHGFGRTGALNVPVGVLRWVQVVESEQTLDALPGALKFIGVMPFAMLGPRWIGGLRLGAAGTLSALKFGGIFGVSGIDTRGGLAVTWRLIVVLAA